MPVVRTAQETETLATMISYYKTWFKRRGKGCDSVRSKGDQKAPWKVWVIEYIIIIITTTREEPMVQTHSRTPQDYVQWVSRLLAHTGSYGIVSRLGRACGCRPPDALPMESQRPGSTGSSVYPCCPRSTRCVPSGAGDLDAVGGGPCQLSGHPTVSVDEASAAGQLGHDYQRGPESRKARPGLDEPACACQPAGTGRR